MTFSLVIPVYNVAPFLRECLESILAQTFSDWEAICVDDGSTDVSGAILDEYVGKDKRFRVIHKENGGVASARNVALGCVRGEFVWFIDADDAIHFEALETLANVFSIEPGVEDICVGYVEGSCCPHYSLLSREDRKYDVFTVHDSSTMSTHRTGMCSVVHRTRNLVGKLFEPYCIGEDNLFNLQVFWQIKKWARIWVPLYFYRQRDDSACHKRANLRTVVDFFETERRYTELLKQNAEQWSFGAMRCYFEYESSFIFRSYKDMLFYLPKSDFNLVVGAWYELLRMFSTVFPSSFYKRAVVFLVFKTKSIVLGRLFVLMLPDLCQRPKKLVKRVMRCLR